MYRTSDSLLRRLIIYNFRVTQKYELEICIAIGWLLEERNSLSEANLRVLLHFALREMVAVLLVDP